MNCKKIGKGKSELGMRRKVMAVAIGALFAGGVQAATISGTVKDMSGAALTTPFDILTGTYPSGSSATCVTYYTDQTGHPANDGTFSCTVADGFSGDIFVSNYASRGMLFSPVALTNATGAITQDFSARTNVLTVTGTVKDSANAVVSSASFSLIGGSFMSWPEFNCSTINSTTGDYTCALDTTAAGASLKPSSSTNIFSGYTISSATTQTNNFTALVTHTISGTLTDLNGSPIANAWAQRMTTSGSTTTGDSCYLTTDASGNFSCMVADGFTGYLEFYAQTSNILLGRIYYAQAVTADQSAQNLTRWPQISGVVKDSAGNPLSGVSVCQYNNGIGNTCVQSDASGNYAVPVPSGFIGALQFSKSGYVFDNVGYNSAVTADVSATAVAAVQTWNIAGTVKDSSGNMLSGVYFMLVATDGSSTSWNQQSDSSGAFSVAVRTGYSGKIRPSKQGHLFNDLSYALVGSDQTGIVVQAQPAWLISGTVKDRDGTTALQNVSVQFGSGSNWEWCANTDASGSYSCAVRQGFTGSLRFYSTGKSFADLALTSVAADSTNQNITALTTYAISGTIKDSSNQALANVTVFLKDAQNNWNYCGNSDTSGAYQCNAANGFSGVVTFNKTGYYFSDIALTNVTAAATGQNVTALATYAISGTVKDGAGAAIGGAPIYLMYSTGGTWVGGNGNCATSATDGTYTCPAPVSATSIQVYSIKTGYAFTQVNNGSLSGNLSGQNIIGVPVPLSIIGVVKDTQGQPVSGASLWWDANDGFHGNCGNQTGTDGVYTCPVPQNFTGTLRANKTGMLFPLKKYSGMTSSSVTDDIQAIAAITLSGMVKDASGNAIAGAQVNYFDASQNVGFYCATSGSDGTYSCLVPQGLTGNLSASKSGSVFSRINVTQALNTDTAYQDFTAAAVTHTISGTVSDSSGPVAGAWTYWANASDSGGCGYSDSSGNFTCLVADGFSGDIGAAKSGYQGAVMVVSNVTQNVSDSNITMAAAAVSTPAFSTAPAAVLTTATKVGMGKLIPLHYFQLSGIGSQTLSSVKVRIANPLGNLAASDFANVALYKFNGGSFTPVAGTTQTTVDVSGSGDTTISTSGVTIDQTSAYVVAATMATTPTDGASFTVTIPANAVTLSADSPTNGQVDSTVILTIDAIAPTLSNTAMGNIGTSSATFSATSSESGTGYFVVLPASASAPDALQVGAGKDSTGATAGIKDNATLAANTAKSFNIAGLAASTAYKLYFVATDGAFGNGSPLDVQSFTTSAAQVVDTGTYTPPSTSTSASGTTTTVGNNSAPVDAGAGSSMTVTSGTSGATINLPTPTDSGTATDAVTFKIDGMDMGVKPMESGSVVKTATISVGGKDTTVLNVTAGTAQVKATAANQPLVSVGTGTNAVVISSGSASATVITSVDKTTGVTSLTLPKSTTGNDADAAVKMNIGGQDVSVKPQGGADVVVTLKTVSVGGKDVQVVAVTGGSATVTSTQSNQPLLAIGSGSSAVVVTSGSVGSEATSKVDSATGTTTLSITSGTITLPSNAFAEMGNGFAAIKDGKLYAGEVAVLNSAGKVASVRLGTMAADSTDIAGDPVKLPAISGLTSKATVPSLKGKVARISETQSFSDAIVAMLGTGFASQGQSAYGVLQLSYSGGVVKALPVGSITVDTDRQDGVKVNSSGNVEVVKNGVMVTFAPSVGDLGQFAGQLTKADKTATVTLSEDGSLQVSFNGVTYPVQTGWTATKETNGGASGFTVDGDGVAVFQDAEGNTQKLYPRFADLKQLVQTFQALDAKAGVAVGGDGSVTATFMGKQYTLKPDYALAVIPAEHAKDAWWQGTDGKVYIKSGDGKTAQGFAVK